MNSLKRFLVLIAFLYGIFGINPRNIVYAYHEENNDFIPNAFPEDVSSKVFSIPLDADEVMVVYPHVLKSNMNNLQTLLFEKCGNKIPFFMADNLSENCLGNLQRY